MPTVLFDPTEMEQAATRYRGAAAAADAAADDLRVPPPPMPEELVARAKSTTKTVRADLAQQADHCRSMSGELRRRANLARRADAAGENTLPRAMALALASFGEVPLLDRELIPPFVGGTVPAGGRLKVKNTGQSPLEWAMGWRKWVYPEEISQTQEMGGGGALARIGANGLKKIGIGAGKAGPPRTGIVPGGGLLAHEGTSAGHTLARHVGKTNTWLRRRLANPNQQHVRVASSYNSRALAEDAVAGTLKAQHMNVQVWLSTSSTRPLILTQEFNRTIGRSIPRATGQVQNVSKARTMLVKDNSKLGYHVKTSYPTP